MSETVTWQQELAIVDEAMTDIGVNGFGSDFEGILAHAVLGIMKQEREGLASQAKHLDLQRQDIANANRMHALREAANVHIACEHFVRRDEEPGGMASRIVETAAKFASFLDG